MPVKCVCVKVNGWLDNGFVACDLQRYGVYKSKFQYKEKQLTNPANCIVSINENPIANM